MLITQDDIRDEILKISEVNPSKCMMCGKCTASCPSSSEMDFNPHRFVKNVTDGNIDVLMKSNTLWTCLSCFACVERCPRAIEPSNLVEAVRLMVTRKQEGGRLKAKDVSHYVEQDDEIPQQLIVSAFRKHGR